EQLTQREEVGIPATVVKNTEHASALARKVRKRSRLGGCHRHRLVDDHVLARLERPARLPEMHLRARCTHDEVDVIACEQLRLVCEYFGLRKYRVNLLASAAHYGRHVEAGRTQERRVEIAPCQAETDQANFECHG